MTEQRKKLSLGEGKAADIVKRRLEQIKKGSAVSSAPTGRGASSMRGQSSGGTAEVVVAARQKATHQKSGPTMAPREKSSIVKLYRGRQAVGRKKAKDKENFARTTFELEEEVLERAVVDESAHGVVTDSLVEPVTVDVPAEISSGHVVDSVHARKKVHAEKLAIVVDASSGALISVPKKGASKQSRRVVLHGPIRVRDLARQMSERPDKVIWLLRKLGERVAYRDLDGVVTVGLAQLVAEELGHECVVQEVADEIGEELLPFNVKQERLVSRAPIVSVMGHVDHGKTTLLDAVLKGTKATSRAGKEAGDITQQVSLHYMPAREEAPDGITFMDTPGHEAFIEMRSKGADLTDLVLLVVAADDSIRPQTLEVIKYAQSVQTPMIVAINKCDKSSADPEKVRQDLARYGVLDEELGGDVPMIEVSAMKEMGLVRLLETITLQSYMLGMQGDPQSVGRAVIVDSQMRKGLGAVLSVIVRNGSLKVGDTVLVGKCIDKVRSMMLPDTGEQVKCALPGMPVSIVGISQMMEAGTTVSVLDKSQVKAVQKRLSACGAQEATIGIGDKQDKLSLLLTNSGKLQIPVVLCAHTNGVLEALRSAMLNLGKASGKGNCQIQICHASVGDLTKSCIDMAVAFNAAIVCFGMEMPSKMQELARAAYITCMQGNVIYKLLEDVQSYVNDLIERAIEASIVARGKIIKVFDFPGSKVAGTNIMMGRFYVGARVRVMRNKEVICEEEFIQNLRIATQDLTHVDSGNKCGVLFKAFLDFEKDDVIEVFHAEQNG